MWARYIAFGEFKNTQLILQLVKTVLRIRPVAVQLRDAQNTFFEICHQHGVFVDFGLAPVHESKFQLALLFLGGDQILLQQTPENDHPTALLPSGLLGTPRTDPGRRNSRTGLAALFLTVLGVDDSVVVWALD